MPEVSVTWLGHAAFRVDSPNGKRVYVDPWLDNPKAPEGEKEPERVDIVAVTHGHDDHVGSAVDISKKYSPEIIALVELKGWLGDQVRTSARCRARTRAARSTSTGSSSR